MDRIVTQSAELSSAVAPCCCWSPRLWLPTSVSSLLTSDLRQSDLRQFGIWFLDALSYSVTDWYHGILLGPTPKRNGWTVIRRIECPLSTERLSGNSVQKMQDKRILGTISRTLLIARKSVWEEKTSRILLRTQCMKSSLKQRLSCMDLKHAAIQYLNPIGIFLFF